MIVTGHKGQKAPFLNWIKPLPLVVVPYGNSKSGFVFVGLLLN